MKKYSILFSLIVIAGLISGCGTKTNNINEENPAKMGNTIPEQVTTSEPLQMNDKIERANQSVVSNGNHYFDHADSIWLDGHWYDSKTGQYGNRYVISFMGTRSNGVIIDPNQPLLVVLEWGRSSTEQWVNYPCPRNIGHLEITAITDDGNLVHFESSEGIKGTFNLVTNKWGFS